MSYPIASVSQALADVAAERERQISAEGYSTAHDDAHADGELAAAACCYLSDIVWRRRCSRTPEETAAMGPPAGWPWEREAWKPKGDREDLVRAAALLIAEIERLDRAALLQTQPDQETPR